MIIRLTRADKKNVAIQAICAVALVIVPLTVVYLLYFMTQKVATVGLVENKDLVENREGGMDYYTITLRLLADDRSSGARAGQSLTYLVNEDDAHWAQIGWEVEGHLAGGKLILDKVQYASPFGPLRVWYEVCTDTEFGAICGGSLSPQSPPRSFTLNTVSVYDNLTVIQYHEQWFGVYLHSQDRIRFTINATGPVHFSFVLSNSTKPNPQALAEEADHSLTIMDEPSITSTSREITIMKDGLYIFVFQIAGARVFHPAGPMPEVSVMFYAERYA